MQFYQETSQQQRQEYIDKLASVLEKEDGVVFAYVFGSALKDNELIKDVDVAVYLNNELEDKFEKELNLGVELESALDYDISIDLIVLNDAPYHIAYEALDGKLLFSKDEEKRTDFIEQTSKQKIIHGYYQQKAKEIRYNTTQ
ncbi:MAG: nucleotidyltransferase domain-containing protein [Candidatus Paceibacteria bacterium]